jgi:hypothetical protein
MAHVSFGVPTPAGGPHANVLVDIRDHDTRLCLVISATQVHRVKGPFPVTESEGRSERLQVPYPPERIGASPHPPRPQIVRPT